MWTPQREELLAELSHIPLGVAAVFAGWARWLELRLPPENRTVPAWIWPVCFVLIGAGLLNYGKSSRVYDAFSPRFQGSFFVRRCHLPAGHLSSRLLVLVKSLQIPVDVLLAEVIGR